MNSLTITATEGLDEQSLLDFLSEVKDEIKFLLLDSVSLPDSRGTVDDESLTIESVSHSNGEKHIAYYCFDWSAYHGCKDKIGTEFQEFCFIYKGNQISIEIEPPEQRGTFDEISTKITIQL